MKLDTVTAFLADACLWCSGAYVALGLHLAASGHPAFGIFGLGMGMVVGPILVARARAVARDLARREST
jgi:hypothetical protein